MPDSEAQRAVSVRPPDESAAEALGQPESGSGGERVGLPDSHLLGTALCNVKHERFEQERLKAEGRFRFTCADQELSHGEKLAILTEEVGEVAQQVLEQPDRRLAFDSNGSREDLRAELTQVAAVAVAWIESLFPEPSPEPAPTPTEGAEVERRRRRAVLQDHRTDDGYTLAFAAQTDPGPIWVKPGVEVMPVADHQERLQKVRNELQRRARDAEAEERRRVSHGMNGAGPHSAMRAYDAAADLLAADSGEGER